MRWVERGMEICSVARTLSVIGDRWTLLIIRDCFLGTRRFSEFQHRLGIAKPRLAERLGKLVDMDVLQKKPYQQSPVRHEYRLTERGEDLYPIIMAMVRWGDRWMNDGRGKPVVYRHKVCGELTEIGDSCSHCGQEIIPRDILPLPGPAIEADRQERLSRGEQLQNIEKMLPLKLRHKDSSET